MVAADDGEVMDGIDLEMLLAVDSLGQRRQLDMARNGVRSMRFEHQDVEDWMDKAHTIGEAESIRVGPQSCDDLEGARHFVREFL